MCSFSASICMPHPALGPSATLSIAPHITYQSTGRSGQATAGAAHCVGHLVSQQLEAVTNATVQADTAASGEALGQFLLELMHLRSQYSSRKLAERTLRAWKHCLQGPHVVDPTWCWKLSTRSVSCASLCCWVPVGMACSVCSSRSTQELS